ncbi:MAG: hypothetical protein J5I65_10800 [Aridibacter famidurans]|nr:hypothetical protein [Aridibacter famidurans]
MRKLILGIALVVCLDAAFIWMMSMEAEIPEMTHAVVPRAAVSLIREKPSLEPVVISDSEPFRDHTPDRAARAEGRKPDLKPASSVRRLNTTRSDQPDTPSVGAKNLFPDTIIYVGQFKTYDSPDAPVKSACDKTPLEPKDSSDGHTRKPEKRSFESRAIGVIKKPYKWIKAFASKISP